MIAGGAPYLWLLSREGTAIAVAVLAGIDSVFCLSYAFSVRRIFGENFGFNYAHNWLGFGLAVACTIDGSSHRGWCGSVCFGAHRSRAPIAIHTWNGANQSGTDEYGRDDYGGLPVKQGHRASVNRRMLYLHRWGCS
jgi:hypothetical protein